MVCNLVEVEDESMFCDAGKHEVILDDVRSEFICVNCGLVVSQEYVSQSYKMHPHKDPDHNDIPSQYVALGDRLGLVDGLGSYMGYHFNQYTGYFRDKNGIPLPSRRQVLYRRLNRRYNRPARFDGQEPTYRTFMIFQRVSENLGITMNVQERTYYLYKKIRKELKKGEFYNHLNLIAVCLYLAVKETKDTFPFTIQEIASAFRKLGHRVTPKSIIKAALDLKPRFPKLFSVVEPTKSEEYLAKIIHMITSNGEIKKRLMKVQKGGFEYEKELLTESRSILEQIPQEKRGSRNTYILAVATIYAAERKLSRKRRKKKSILTQYLLSVITNTAEYSLRDHWTGLLSDYVPGSKKKREKVGLIRLI